MSSWRRSERESQRTATRRKNWRSPRLRAAHGTAPPSPDDGLAPSGFRDAITTAALDSLISLCSMIFLAFSGLCPSLEPSPVFCFVVSASIHLTRHRKLYGLCFLVVSPCEQQSSTADCRSKTRLRIPKRVRAPFLSRKWCSDSSSQQSGLSRVRPTGPTLTVLMDNSTSILSPSHILDVSVLAAGHGTGSLTDHKKI